MGSARASFEVPNFHAHVYFDAATVDKARALCERCRDLFGVKMGRVHEKLVGPHPEWSCQLIIEPEQLGDVLAWLAINRDGLVIFCHPNGPSALQDHRDHAIWMGGIRKLNLAQFEKREREREGAAE
jgi:DOPA 4,5-dioxygenase